MRPNTLGLATKIVCTIGPSSSSPRTLGSMIRSGMDVARINFAHGTYEEHTRDIKTIRKVSKSVKRPVAILQDLPGPKLRVGKLATDPTHLRRSDTVTLTTKATTSNHGKIPIPYPDLPRVVSKGDTIFLADGSIKLEVLTVKAGEVEGKILNGGDLTSGKGVNLPRLRTRVPAFTRSDAEHLKSDAEGLNVNELS